MFHSKGHESSTHVNIRLSKIVGWRRLIHELHKNIWQRKNQLQIKATWTAKNSTGNPNFRGQSLGRTDPWEGVNRFQQLTHGSVVRNDDRVEIGNLKKLSRNWKI